MEQKQSMICIIWSEFRTAYIEQLMFEDHLI